MAHASRSVTSPTRGRRLDRHGVTGGQRPLRRRRRDQRPRPGGDRRARLRVEPRRPQPAQPAHERHRHPRRRHRAVQRRTAEGRRQGAARHPTSSWSSTPAGSAADEGWERRYLSRLERHARPTASSSSRRPWSRSTLDQPVVAVDPHVGGSSLPTVDCPELRGRGRGHRAPARARPPPHRVPRRAPRPRVGAPPRGRATAPRSTQAGIAFDPTSSASAASPRRPPRRRRASCCAARSADGDLRRQRPVGDPDDAHAPPSSASRCPTDLSVVGFDNIPESALTDPPLTTVDQSIQALGHEAVRTARST